MVKLHFLAQFPVDHLAHPVICLSGSWWFYFLLSFIRVYRLLVSMCSFRYLVCCGLHRDLEFSILVFFEYHSEWSNVYIRLRTFFDFATLFLCYLSIRLFLNDPPPSPYFAQKSFCFPCIWLLECLHCSPLLTDSIFSCSFGRSCFILIVWPCVGIFFFLFSSLPSDLSLRVVSFVIYLFQFKMGVVQFKMGIGQFKMEKLL